MSGVIAKILQGLLALAKKPVFWLCAALAVLVAICTIQHRNLVQKEQERARMEDNQTALLSDMEKYRTENGELVASVQALTLKSDELSALIPKYEREIKALKIDLRNAKNMAHVETETSVGIMAPLVPVTTAETNTSNMMINDNNVVDIKNEAQTYEEGINAIRLKLIFYFIIGFIINIIGFCLLTSFCSVFINTKIKLIKCASFAFLFNFIVSVIFCFIITSFRTCSMNNDKSKTSCLYTTSNILTYL